MTSERQFTPIRFNELDLEPDVLLGVDDAGFEQCTPIQAMALPRALEGHDVAGRAQTGTGKTAAFLLATMTRLLREPTPSNYEQGRPRALVLAPTRELAIQIHKDALVLGRHTGLTSGVVFGGTGYDSQREMLAAGLDILIGTPGRLIDYLKQGVYSLKSVQVAVLDEADRMFDLGFISDVRYLMRRLPPPEERLNLLFSATLSRRVQELAYEHMNDPELVAPESERVTVDDVSQMLYHVSKDEKISLLIGLLRRTDVTRTIVFVNTKRVGERVYAYLESNGFVAGLLSGDVPQRKRMGLLDRFKGGDLPILVATDVAARGLHIPEVSHVFNFDLPQDAEDYIHRIGRTARAGASGDAVSFACEEYVFSLTDIQDYIGEPIPTSAVTDAVLPKVEKPSRKVLESLKAGRPGAKRSGPRSGGSGRGSDNNGKGRGRRSPSSGTAQKGKPRKAGASRGRPSPGNGSSENRVT